MSTTKSDESLREMIGVDDNDRIILLIMPRNMGRSPGAPRDYSSLWARAHVVAEWEDDAWHVVKHDRQKPEKKSEIANHLNAAQPKDKDNG